MRVGFVGLGRLGLPCSLTLAAAGHSVVGYDVTDHPSRVLRGAQSVAEDGLVELVASSPSLRLTDSIESVVDQADVVFIAVQTPHAPQFGGDVPMPSERRDFEYGFLTQAVREVCRAAERRRRTVTVAVVSTALPGTFNRHLRHLSNQYATLVYNPFFIAMGTTIQDLRDPEFVLVGADHPEDADPLRAVYAPLHEKPIIVMPIESAELTKVSYNTFISLKIVFANTILEIAQKTGADCDVVVDALTMATDRVTSAKYLRGGMGDAGACHPRDLIAMSWLAQRLDLSTDLMGYAARAREAQTEWLAVQVVGWAELVHLPLVLLGKAYKPGSESVDGSSGLLLAHALRRRGYEVTFWDLYVDGAGSAETWSTAPSVFVVSTRHPEWPSLRLPSGSVVVDPFGYMPDRAGVTVVRLGRKG